MTTTENPLPDPQKCKLRALNRLHQLNELKRECLEKRWSSNHRWEAAQLLDEAQVWATLATVPEPLETLTATAELVSAPTLGAVFPKLVCPHGYHARLVPLSTEEIDEVNFPTTLHYTFSPDCETCP